MDATLRLGDRNPLHPVHAGLELQPGERHVVDLGLTLGFDRYRRVLHPAQVGLLHVDDLHAPAPGLRVAVVHAHQITGEQRGFIPALAGLDLQDRVRVVEGVARNEQLAQAFSDFLAL